MATEILRIRRDRILSPDCRRVLREAPAPPSRPVLDACFRLIDMVGAVSGLLLTLPIILAAAVAVKLEDGGPIFFRQQRLGLNGRSFSILKFRSMRVDASKTAARYRVARNDDRITRVGRILRDYHIDELPQLVNVAKGDMGLVGPRPTLLFHKDFYETWEMVRLAQRPGVTGLSQVLGANALSWDDRIVIDVWYVRNRSFGLYVWILLRTVLNLFGKHGVVNAQGEVKGWTRGVPKEYGGDL